MRATSAVTIGVRNVRPARCSVQKEGASKGPGWGAKFAFNSDEASAGFRDEIETCHCTEPRPSWMLGRPQDLPWATTAWPILMA